MTKPETIIDNIADATQPAHDRLEQIEARLRKLLEPERRSALKRYPTMFALLVGFGVATTYYGFEKVADTIPFVRENPFLMMLLGIIILAGTGTLYKKL